MPTCRNVSLPRHWGGGRAAIADGTHVKLRGNNLLGSRHIRYGAYGGIAYQEVRCRRRPSTRTWQPFDPGRANLVVCHPTGARGRVEPPEPKAAGLTLDRSAPRRIDPGFELQARDNGRQQSRTGLNWEFIIRTRLRPTRCKKGHKVSRKVKLGENMYSPPFIWTNPSNSTVSTPGEAGSSHTLVIVWSAGPFGPCPMTGSVPCIPGIGNPLLLAQSCCLNLNCCAIEAF